MAWDVSSISFIFIFISMANLDVSVVELSGMLRWVGVLLIFTLCIEQLRRRKHCGRGLLPPGPKGWPVIGNLLDLKATKLPWILYHDWACQYGELAVHSVQMIPNQKVYKGDLVHIKLFQSHLIVVDSVEVAMDLMDKRSAIYSDKPASTMDKLSVLIFILRSN